MCDVCMYVCITAQRATSSYSPEIKVPTHTRNGRAPGGQEAREPCVPVPMISKRNLASRAPHSTLTC